MSGVVGKVEGFEFEFKVANLGVVQKPLAMFGSDRPVCLLAATYGEVIGAADALTAALSPSQRPALFGGTASRWYGIPAC